ncbi:Rrf2 family transcriptional regulator [Pseudonocardia sp. NPDC046786]|uniref:RrF2 family transcriptional regulator n=1 Tax=Pseudonocardia sp. NPDC046786 TaxID=3155471 RepID=UPI0033DB7595
MRVSARVDYAVRAVVRLAVSQGSPISAASLAETEQIPSQFLELILADIRRSGIAVGHRGARGGFSLARPPDKISLADVVQAVDGPVATVRGELAEQVSYDGPAAPLQDVWIAARTALLGVLESVTIAQVVNGNLPPGITTVVRDASRAGARG